ncbi:MAG: redoxin domain-containing protein [Candidatus Hydrogenedentes bacterium]|nr:redoxin domain-containing protein [Candidatus Hydrogenedentota bacterium]
MHALRCCAILYCAVLPAFSAEYPQPLAIGASAPAFQLPGVDGKEYHLEDFAEAKVLAIIFTCNHCPTAQAYEERIKAVAAEYEDKGVALVAISPNDPLALRLDELGYTDLGDSLEDMKIRARDHGFNFPYLFDGETQAVSRQYGPASTPHAFVFDHERKLRYAGRIDDSEDPAQVKQHDLRDAIDALLADKPLVVEKTKTMGCSTKWSDKRSTVQESLAKWDREEVTLNPTSPVEASAAVQGPAKKLRLVNVWATWCVPCLEEMPDLVEMHRMYRGRPFELITISMDGPERREQALEFLKKYHVSARNYIAASDDTYALADAIDQEWAGGLPFTMVVAPDGRVVYRTTGRLDALEVKRAIVGVLGRTYH